MVNTKHLIFETNKYIYDFQQFEAIRFLLKMFIGIKLL